MTRRSVLRAALSAGLTGSAVRAFAQTPAPTGPFLLPKLNYSFRAREPHIDAETMEIHHDRHHQAYVNNLNTALAKYPDLGVISSRLGSLQNAEELVRRLDTFPADIRTAVRNNGGGHANHSLFWMLMDPQDYYPQPIGGLANHINSTFGDFDKFKAAFEGAGVARFGSGWVWLVLTKEQKLEIVSTPNQDSPILDGKYPLLGNDLWEHAYYLKYRNKRADYLKAWWNVVSWNRVYQRHRDGFFWIANGGHKA